VRSAVAQRDHQVRGLARHVQASRNPEPLQRLFLQEALTNRLQHRHLLPGPLDLALASIRQPDIFHITFFQFCDSQSAAPLVLKFRANNVREGDRKSVVVAGSLDPCSFLGAPPSCPEPVEGSISRERVFPTALPRLPLLPPRPDPPPYAARPRDPSFPK